MLPIFQELSFRKAKKNLYVQFRAILDCQNTKVALERLKLIYIVTETHPKKFLHPGGGHSPKILYTESVVANGVCDTLDLEGKLGRHALTPKIKVWDRFKKQLSSIINLMGSSFLF